MSVRAKLYFIIFTMLCLTSIISFMGIASLNQYKDKTETLSRSVHRVSEVQRQKNNFLQFESDLHRYVENNEGDYGKLMVTQENLRNDMKQLQDASLGNAYKEKLITADKELSAINKTINRVSKRAGRLDRATSKRDVEEVDKHVDRIVQQLSEMTIMTRTRASKLHKESLQAYMIYKAWLIFISIIIVSIGLILGHLLTRKIARSVQELHIAADDFIGGNWDRRINKPMSGEFTILANSFNHMADSVQAVEQVLLSRNERLEKEIDERTFELTVANEEIEQRMGEITAYLETANSLSSTTDVQEALSSTVNNLSSIFPIDSAVLSLIDEASLLPCWAMQNCKQAKCPAYKSANLECWAISQTHCRESIQGKFTQKITECSKCKVFQNIKTKIAALHDLDENFFLGKELSINDSLCGQTILTLKAIVKSELDSITDTFTMKTMANDIVTQISVPLITKDRVLGAIAFGFKSRKSFSHREIDFLLSVANQIAITIENFKLYENARDAAAKYSTLHRAGVSMESTIKKDEIADHFLKHAIEMSLAGAGVIALLNQQTQELEISAQKNIDDEMASVIGKKIGGGIAGWVAKTGKPIIIDKRIEEPRFKKILQNVDFESAIFVPLRYNEEVFGVIGLIALTGRHFNDNDLQLLTTLSGQAAAAMRNVQLFDRLKDLYYETIKAFVQAIEAKDSYTKGHSENVAEYSIAIAVKMGLPFDQTEKLRTAALLHDIGKIGIKEEVLNKPGRLSPDEYNHIKEHPTISSQIISHIPMLEDVGEIILHHHERYDGNGYPDGLKGEEIPLGSRILAVADTFDAMTSNRTYRNATPFEEAKNEIIKNAGTQFDPAIVSVFVELLDNNELPQIATIIDSRFSDSGHDALDGIPA